MWLLLYLPPCFVAFTITIFFVLANHQNGNPQHKDCSCSARLQRFLHQNLLLPARQPGLLWCHSGLWGWGSGPWTQVLAECCKSLPQVTVEHFSFLLDNTMWWLMLACKGAICEASHFQVVNGQRDRETGFSCSCIFLSGFQSSHSWMFWNTIFLINQVRLMLMFIYTGQCQVWPF